MNILFKILCEVKLLHEYYLTERDGNTIFDIPAQEGRLQFLQEKLTDNYPSISDNLSYEIAPYSQEIFSGYRLKLMPSYSGFQIAVAVTEKELPGGAIGYEPKISLPADLAIGVLLRRKNAMLDTISNANLKSSIPSAYFFTNLTVAAQKTYPFLSLPVPERNFLFAYEQGNLSFDPSDNTIKAFYIDKSGVEQWAPVVGEGFISEADRIMVPLRFFYTFHAIGVSEANFVLTDQTGNTIKTVQEKLDPQTRRVLLDFTDAVDISGAAAPGPNMVYSLKVNGDNGFVAVHPLVFNTPSFPSDTWGLVTLVPRAAQSAYHLLDNEGLLMTRLDASGNPLPPPVFEIRIKSRFTFWRYRNNKQRKIKANSSLDPYLEYDAQSGVMETITFRNATHVPTIFKDGSNTRYLPNPSSYELISSENQRVYIEIPVPRSDMFDI